MKKSFLKILALTVSLSVMIVVSCSKPNSGGGYTPTPSPQPEPTPQPTGKIVVPSSVSLKPVVTSESKGTTIPFTAAEPWTASVTSTKADSWIDVNPKSGGAGSANIIITATVNESYESRTATIVIVCGGDTITIVFTQEGKKKETVKVSGVTLDKTSLTLTEGDTHQFTATVTPSNAEDKSVYWSSDNNPVAAVDQNGNLTAVKAGTATITVTTSDGDKTATCTVTVEAKSYPVTGVGLDNTSLTLTEGDSRTLIATVTPENATNKSVTWSSTNVAVATVDNNGNLTAVKAGTATITVTTSDGGKTATCTVTVEAKSYPVTGVTLDNTSLTLTEGDSRTLIATVTPENATNKSVTWSSTNVAVATVDNNGNVVAVKAGTSIITVKTTDGNKTANCTVTVKEKERSGDIEDVGFENW